MKINFYITFIILILTSCSATKEITEKRCKTILKNDYKTILEEKFISIVGRDTIFLNEVKYECVYTAMYIQKGMYDRFGRWSQEIYPKGKKHPLLLWKNVKLFADDPTEFIVAANGLESKETIYASVLVFDNKSNDMLAENSAYKSKLIAYFSELIKTNNTSKTDFYEMYWKTVDPILWGQMKNNLKNK